MNDTGYYTQYNDDKSYPNKKLIAIIFLLIILLFFISFYLNPKIYYIKIKKIFLHFGNQKLSFQVIYRYVSKHGKRSFQNIKFIF